MSRSLKEVRMGTPKPIPGTVTDPHPQENIDKMIPGTNTSPKGTGNVAGPIPGTGTSPKR